MGEEKTERKESLAGHDLNDRILKYTGVFGGVQGLVTLVTVIRTKIMAWLLGPVGFGINESFNRTLNLVRNTTDLGIPFSAVRSISAEYAGESDCALRQSVLVTRSWALLTALAGAMLCALMSPLFSLWAFEGDRGYTLSFLMLSPMVAFSAITGGEMAVLKGLRKLKEIAVSQFATVIATLCISIPLFYFFGLRGIVLSLVTVSFCTMVLTCAFSFRAMPYRVSLSDGKVMKQGSEMVKLGVFFTMASFFGSGAFSVIANYLMKNGGSEILGAYSAGYALMNYLAMFVFSAMETDYFPRLSSSAGNAGEANVIMKQQIEVAAVLMTPMIVGFIVFLEPIVKLLLTDEFCVAVPMARIASLSLFFKAVTQPMAYMSLAKGDSRTFLIQEVLYDVFLVAAVILGFRLGGLEMTGTAITLAGIFDMAVVGLIVRRKYGIRVISQTMPVLQLLVWPMILTYLSVTFTVGVWRWVLSIILLGVSLFISIRELKRRTTVMDALKEKIRNRFGR